MRLPIFALLALTLSAGFSCTAEDAQEKKPQGRAFGEPKLAVKLSDARISESSGLARSHARPGWYATHNDSGDIARFWLFDLSGKVEGPFEVRGARAVDWEDMASAKIGGKCYLYFADIGDNAERRESVQVYRVEESMPTGPADVFELRYPDGPHNAEAFMVDPKTGDFWIVTKTSKGPSKVMQMKSPGRPGACTLSEVGETDFGGAMEAARLVTGGDVSADGRFLVLRTYLSAYEFDFGLEWWKSKPRLVRTAAEVQGEAIAYSLDGRSLFTSSEFSPCLISRSERTSKGR